MIGLGNPYIGIAAIGLVLSHGYAYVKGRGHGGDAVQAKYAKAADKAMAAMRHGERAIDAINGAYAASAARQDQENRSIRHVAYQLVARPIYRSACVDADGVGLLDRARANANLAGDSGEPAAGAGRAAGLSEE